MSATIYGLSRALSWFGGGVLALLALLSVFSIAGRALSGSGLGLGPVPGDFELVEAGTALAVFCFLPWAHLKRGHATVDLFWRLYPRSMQRVLNVLADALMLAVWLLLVWRMGVATGDYRSNGEVAGSRREHRRETIDLDFAYAGVCRVQHADELAPRPIHRNTAQRLKHRQTVGVGFHQSMYFGRACMATATCAGPVTTVPM
jgi:hypothetical protein